MILETTYAASRMTIFVFLHFIYSSFSFLSHFPLLLLKTETHSLFLTLGLQNTAVEQPDLYCSPAPATSGITGCSLKSSAQSSTFWVTLALSNGRTGCYALLNKLWSPAHNQCIFMLEFTPAETERTKAHTLCARETKNLQRPGKAT